eukprot:TRINITY_DN3865_c0_g1_i1.p2 TRINITY_DN3865_c0_g1~~TRINITY_DN3865_c0_g1_i1.p2  ORF type:complete len:482 (+),score=97.16 TRINITY_DN3865_c0_g1_i1:135-1580(+)
MVLRTPPAPAKSTKRWRKYLPLVVLVPLLVLLRSLPISITIGSPPTHAPSHPEAVYPIAHLLNILSYLPPDSRSSSSALGNASAFADNIAPNPNSLLAQYRLISPVCPRQPYLPHLLRAIESHRSRTAPSLLQLPQHTLLAVIEPAAHFSSNDTSLTRAYVAELVLLAERFAHIKILAQPSLPSELAQVRHDAVRLLKALRSFDLPVQLLAPLNTDDAVHLVYNAKHVAVHHGPFSALAALVTRGKLYHTRAFDAYMNRDEFKWQIRDAVAADPNVKPSVYHPRFAAMGPVVPSCCRFDEFGVGDEKKVICANARNFGGEQCWVVSLGCNGKWKFEEAIIERTNCVVHTLDCTGEWPVPDKLKSRVTLHKICIGTKSDAKKRNNYYSWHKIVQLESGMPSLLKMDVEGKEYAVLNEMLAGGEELLPEQMAVEIHIRQQSHTVPLFQNLSRKGYQLVHRADNPFCASCSEVTIVKQVALPAV